MTFLDQNLISRQVLYMNSREKNKVKKKEKRTEEKRRGKEEGEILTKYTRSARRKIFPHKHVLFHKSGKLSWNELEKSQKGKS